MHQRIPKPARGRAPIVPDEADASDRDVVKRPRLVREPVAWLGGGQRGMGRPVGHPRFQIRPSGNWTGVARAARRTDCAGGPTPLTTESTTPVPRHGRCSAVSVAPVGERPAGGDLKEDGMKSLVLGGAML